MSYRYNSGFVKPGLNTLVSPSPAVYATTLWGAGENANGQLGLGNTTKYSSPKQVGSLTDWNLNSYSPTVSGSVAFLKTDGTLWTCGRNLEGQLGLGNITNYSSPKQVGSLTNWKQVSFGLSFCLSVKTNGTLWSWGTNASGALGLGNVTSYSSPKQVGSLTNWSSVSCAGAVVATKTDGTLWTWGGNTYGQLGLGNRTDYSSPKQVGSLTNWLYVAAGYQFVVALKTDNSLWAWGRNQNGQLGQSNITDYSSPKQVGSLTNWTSSIVAASYFLAAIKSNGELWAWGYNNRGQLGLGNVTKYSSPKQVGSLTTWLKISSGGYHISSIKTDGTLWTWGANGNGGGTLIYGQLALGTNASYSSPKQVGSLTTWSGVSNTYYDTFATQTTVTPESGYTWYGGSWKLNAASAAQGAGTWAVPNSAYLVLLCHFDNGNGSTTFTDSSSKANTLTPFNGAAQSSTQYKFAPSSFYSGSAAAPSAPYITLPNTYMNFGTNDFTFSTWYYATGTYPSYGVFFDNGGQGFAAQFDSTGTALIFTGANAISGSVITSSAHGMTAGNWYYLAWVKKGNALTMYVNGTSIGSGVSNGGSFSPASGATAYINTFSGLTGSYPVGGYLDELAVFNGVALYNGDFTPPTTPF